MQVSVSGAKRRQVVPLPARQVQRSSDAQGLLRRVRQCAAARPTTGLRSLRLLVEARRQGDPEGRRGGGCATERAHVGRPGVWRIGGRRHLQVERTRGRVRAQDLVTAQQLESRRGEGGAHALRSGATLHTRNGSRGEWELATLTYMPYRPYEECRQPLKG